MVAAQMVLLFFPLLANRQSSPPPLVLSRASLQSLSLSPPFSLYAFVSALHLRPVLIAAVFAQEGEENEDQQQFGQEAADVADAGDDAETVDEVVNEAAADADVTVDDSTTIRAHPLTDIPPAAAGIITAVVFPDNAAKGTHRPTRNTAPS